MQHICEKCLHIISDTELGYCVNNRTNFKKNVETENNCDCILCPVYQMKIYSTPQNEYRSDNNGSNISVSSGACPICLQCINMAKTPIIKYKCDHWVCLKCQIEFLRHCFPKLTFKCPICTENISMVNNPISNNNNNVADYKIFGGITLFASDFYDNHGLTLNIDLDMSVDELKRLMSLKIHLPELLVVFNDTLLEDDKMSLRDYGITACSIIKFSFSFS